MEIIAGKRVDAPPRYFEENLKIENEKQSESERESDEGRQKGRICTSLAGGFC